MPISIESFGATFVRVFRTLVAFLFLEELVVALVWRNSFAGTWEVLAAWVNVLPLGAAVALVMAPVLGAGIVLSEIPRRGRWVAPIAVASITFLCAVDAASGRRLLSYRYLVGIAAAFVAFGTTFAAQKLLRGHKARLIVVGALLACGGWLLDLFVLPRLYPGLHAWFVALAAFGIAILSQFVSPSRTGPRGWALACVAVLGLSYRARAEPPKYDNIRFLLAEHAPWAGRVVTMFAHEAETAADASSTSGPDKPSAARALHWEGRDILLLTIDALRSDHVGVYGYNRPTTPNIDRIAKSGVRFEYAYCPTPHTSYSVTSFMTGKYMRPLLAMGLGEDSETWAGYFRTYGYRTAAFYPPAVFFIDQDRFTRFSDSHLGFEYAKVEFAKPEVRLNQVENYLRSAPADHPLFLWVHLFEPHEPYEKHSEHDFGEKLIDRYDGEIAVADDLVGKISSQFLATRSEGIVIVSADHGEEFGDHGGAYHGTTVYEEQVRVPLVIAGRGIRPRVVQRVVQTIDLLPTVLSATGIPRPPRIRGSDLGMLVAGADDDSDGFAFVETETQSLAAQGKLRLVCQKAVAACRLFDIEKDRGETRDITGAADPKKLREALRVTLRDHGSYEGPKLPDALRRGIAGDRESGQDVAALLDDANVNIRMQAASVLFQLQSPESAAALARAKDKDENSEVRELCTLAHARLTGTGLDFVVPLLDHKDLRDRAALVLAERSDSRGEEVLAVSLRGRMDFETATHRVSAAARIHSKLAVPALVDLLSDVRLRPFVAKALGTIGDSRARIPLLKVFSEERYVSMREPESRALVELGVRQELDSPLAKFAGMPEPFPHLVEVALASGTIERQRFNARKGALISVSIPPGAMRVFVFGSGDAPPTIQVGAKPLASEAIASEGLPDHQRVWQFEIPDGDKRAMTLAAATDRTAVWLVQRVPEIPPPPPVVVDAGATNSGP